MLTDKDKKAIEKLNAACQGIADLDYIGFYIFAKENTKEAIFKYNLKSYKAIAHFIAAILVSSASRFGITPEDFLKAVEENFQSEVNENVA